MSIETIRTLIADPLIYGVATAAGDGGSVEFQTPNYPVYPGSAKVYLDGTLLTLTTDYTLEEEFGLVTLVSAPTDGQQIKISCKFSLLTDDQIQSMLDLQSTEDDTSDMRLAAADCLDSIASSQALIQKKIKLLDLETDGPALSKALREGAKALRALVFADDMSEADFDIAEQINNGFGYREKIRKDWQRSS